MTPPQMGDVITDIVERLQKNTFTCLGCGEHTVFTNNKHTPTVPCENCGDTRWKIFAINDVRIYP